MKTALPFEFIVNKELNTVQVTKEFAANLDQVWEAFTNPEILDQWWAPKPWRAKTKSLEFKIGGRRLYAMCGPEGEEHWALADFTAVKPKTNFKYLDAFCDSMGNLTDELPRSEWNIDFIDKGKSTLVSITIQHKTLSDLEKIIQLGFKEGFAIAINGLEEIFSAV